jgi:hypothetical protein
MHQPEAEERTRRSARMTAQNHTVQGILPQPGELSPFAQIVGPSFGRIDEESQQGNELRVPSQSP